MQAMNISKLTFSIFCLAIFSNFLTAQSNDQAPLRQMPGIVAAENSAELAANVASTLLKIHVSEGDRVEAGQLLASLDYRESKAAFDASVSAAKDRSQLVLAEIDVDESSTKLARIKSAQSSGASNQTELARATNDLKRAQARLELERSRIEQAQKNSQVLKYKLENYLVRAPFDGVITEVRKKVGNLVASGEPVINVVHYSNLTLDLHLPLALFGKMNKGRSYKLFADEPVKSEINAVLTFVSPVVDSASQTFLAKFKVENRSLNLPSGFSAKLSENQMQQLVNSNKPSEKSLSANSR